MKTRNRWCLDFAHGAEFMNSPPLSYFEQHTVTVTPSAQSKAADLAEVDPCQAAATVRCTYLSRRRAWRAKGLPAVAQRLGIIYKKSIKTIG
jgi:hypothetical protein